MSAPLPDTPTGRGLHLWLLWFTGVAAAISVIVAGLFIWIEANKTPTITFLATPQAQIVVDARGAVSTPGVVTLPVGSRMVDVVAASGGLADNADESLINLSSRVFDGQMITVPTLAVETDTTASRRMNINTASIDQLTALPGIGDVLAGRIVAYREANGPFQGVDDLLNVEGISPGVLDGFRDLITVTNDG